MKSLLRIVCATAITIVLFGLFNWLISGLIYLTVSWKLIWFVVSCFIAYFVLIWSVTFISGLVFIPINGLKKHKEILIMKHVLKIVSWGISLISCGATFKFLDFSIAKQCAAGILYILINLSIPTGLNRRMNMWMVGLIPTDGYETYEISSRMVKLIKRKEITYYEAVRRVQNMRNAKELDELQTTLIISVIQSKINL